MRQTKQARLKSVPGVGKVVALLPELGQLSTQKISTLGGRCSPQPGQRRDAGEAHHFWRASGSPPNVGHGNPSCGAPHPRDSRLLCSVNGTRQTDKGGVGCLYAQVVNHSQCQDETGTRLATETTLIPQSCSGIGMISWTFKIIASPWGEGVIAA